GGSGTDYPLTIGSGQFIEGFEDRVVDHKIGDTYDWEGKFPDNYNKTEYAGKPVVFTITVKSISEQVVPEL
ncbi:FKBP-type peptidyl-prolyl cis-trans isomerase, partial [Bacteroides xylanisolvens]|uniref:FKBP-type peptidyl-prolyl cis-trans isomerase n=1 Tax=Bacteroides xylanisolvens TaxID=371601 RepID=UPI001AA0B3D2